jgi:hypothetical protein
MKKLDDNINQNKILTDKKDNELNKKQEYIEKLSQLNNKCEKKLGDNINQNEALINKKDNELNKKQKYIEELSL